MEKHLSSKTSKSHLENIYASISEAAVGRCSPKTKICAVKIMQYSQENTCVGVSF